MDPLTEIAHYFYTNGHDGIADAIVALPEFSPQSRTYINTRNAVAELVCHSEQVPTERVTTLLQAFDPSITPRSVESVISNIKYLETLYIKKDTDAAIAILNSLPQSTDLATRQNLTALLTSTSEPSSTLLSSLNWDPASMTTIHDARSLLVDNLMRLSPMYTPSDALDRTIADALAYRSLFNPSISNQKLPTKLKHKLRREYNEVWVVKYSPNGRYLATGSNNCTIFVYDATDNYSLVASFDLNTRSTIYISWSPDSNFFLTLTARSIRIWSVLEKTCITTIEGNMQELGRLRTARFTAAAFTPDYATTKHIFISSNDVGLYIVDTITTTIVEGQGLLELIEDFVILNDTTIWAISTTQEVFQIELPSFRQNYRLMLPEKPLAISAAPSWAGSDHILVNLNRSTLVLINTGSNDTANTLPHIETFFYTAPIGYTGMYENKFNESPSYVIRGCAGETPTGLVISGGVNGEVWMWAPQGNVVASFIGHKQSVNCVDWRPHRGPSPEWASASDDGTVCVWSVEE